jgi:threonine aldolase
MEALMRTNLEQTIGYGEDAYCEAAARMIRDLCKGEPDVHFLVGGTQTNLTVIAAALRPYQSVLCAQQGHIYVHETGAIEAVGHKVVPLPSQDGKLTAKQVRQAVQNHREDVAREHTTQPKMVYLTMATELGAVYTRGELEAIHTACRELDLFLYLDGARLGYGLCDPGCDLDLETLAALCDVFYIGGTKQGALFGEALVISNPALKADFRYMIKQKGGLLAKGRLLGIQFLELFRDGLYFELAHHANALAAELRGAFRELGHEVSAASGANLIFVVLPDRLLARLEDSYVFDYNYPVDGERSLVRFCTSWATDKDHVAQLIEDLKRFCGQPWE